MQETSKAHLNNNKNPARWHLVVLGCCAGGGVFLIIMLLLTAGAITFGLIRGEEAAGQVDLSRWLTVQVVGGFAASVVGGLLCRRISHCNRGPLLLAIALFCIGAIESGVMQMFASQDNPTWMIMISPVVAAMGVLVGGWRPSAESRSLQPRSFSLQGRARTFYLVSPLVVLAGASFLGIIMPELSSQRKTEIVAAALTLDLTIVVPGLVYAFVVRTGIAPLLILIPTFILGYFVASATIPAPYHSTLDIVRLLLIPAELAVIVYLIVLGRRAIASQVTGSGDFASRLRSTVRQIVNSRIPADILTTEVSILYYAFHRTGSAARKQEEFTVYRTNGYLTVVWGLMIALVVETVGVHFVVSIWSSLAAWILTGLSIYVCIWLTGDYRALAARRILLRPSHLLLRVGIRWEAEIPIALIKAAESLSFTSLKRKKDTLDASILGLPNLTIMFNEPVEFIGLYGIRRVVTEIRLSVDNAGELIRELNRIKS